MNWEDLVTMVIWIGHNPEDVQRLRSDNTRIGDATSQILFSFYSSASPTERWASLKAAVTQLDKHNAVTELGMDELQAEPERQSGRSTYYRVGALKCMVHVVHG